MFEKNPGISQNFSVFVEFSTSYAELLKEEVTTKRGERLREFRNIPDDSNENSCTHEFDVRILLKEVLLLAD